MSNQWYVRKGSRIYGPLSCEEIAYRRLQGRFNNTDKVSQDGEFWEEIHAVPQMIHEGLLDIEIPMVYE